MIEYIDDHVECDCCREEVSEGYRIAHSTLCKECLRELNDNLNRMFRRESD